MPAGPDLEPLLAAPVPSDPTARADGAAVAFVVTTPDRDHDRWRRCVHLVGADGTRLGTTAGPADRHPRFAPVGDALAFVRPDGDGVDQVVAWPDGQPLCRTDRSVRSFAWSPDARRIAAVVVHPPERTGPLVFDGPAYKRDGTPFAAGAADELVVLDLATGSVTSVLGPRRVIGDVAWANDGHSLVVALPHDDRSWRWDLHRTPLDGSGSTVLTDHGDWDRAACPVPLDDGTVLYVGGEAGPRHAVLHRSGHGPLAADLDRNVTTGVPAYPGAPPVVIGRQVLFTANDGGVSRLCSTGLDGGTATWRSAPDELVTGVAATTTTFVTVAAPELPGEVRVLDGPIVWSSGTVTAPWTVEPLEVRAPDGATVPCWLLRSRTSGDGPAPVLVDLHGGPHNVANPVPTGGNLHRWFLAAAGWHVLLPNVRGSDGFGEAWYRGLEPGGGWASTDLADVSAVVGAAIAAGLAEPGRIAVHGYSYGGLLAAALTATTDHFAAAAIGGAPVDLRAFVSSADLPTALWEREVGGAPWRGGDYDERSPIRRVGDVRTPTLVVHGTADHRVPVSQAEQWYQGLQAHGVPAQLVLQPGASHGFVTAGSPATVLDVGRRIAEWLLRWT